MDPFPPGTASLTLYHLSFSSSQTGLPNPQPDHAVIMARFAQDCMDKLDRIVERLSDSFGKGTDELALRTGMHSGEVTAGVLRGEKGRFQLFGGEFKSFSLPTCPTAYTNNPPDARCVPLA